ncbi:hypothetical protein [Nakamurella sp.]|uniref:hypothetical protein n=1 Tax=Nakamurella sp. TaxID=1869182 RepID=UPI0037844150
MADIVRSPASSSSSVPGPPAVLRWTALCATAESVGMAASAAAARLAGATVGDGPTTAPAALAALAIIVTGGLIEGTALGVAQASGLAAWLPGRRSNWIMVTVIFAGVGWAAASAPAVLLPDDGAGEPTPFLLTVTAAGLGLLMGAVLGAGQSLVLRGRVPHPWRWSGASALGWAVAMPIIFVGASLPGPQWPLAVVITTGALTGLVAGATLGVISGLLLPFLVDGRVRARPAPGAK